MSIQIELSVEQESALRAKAAARGLTLEAWIQQLADQSSEATEPFTTGYGMLAKYGPAPSAEEIDENRRDMFRGFAEDF